MSLDSVSPGQHHAQSDHVLPHVVVPHILPLGWDERHVLRLHLGLDTGGLSVLWILHMSLHGVILCFMWSIGSKML